MEKNKEFKDDNKKCCCKNKEHNAPCNHSHNEEECACECTEDGACMCECDNAAPLSPETEKIVDSLRAKLAQAEDEAQKNHDNFLRSLADFDTYRRRIQREFEDVRKFSIQPLVEELLPAIDNLELGLDHAKNDAAAKDISVGVQMVIAQIKKTLENFGVKVVDPLGEEFDPKFQECVSHAPSAEYKENKVSSVMRKGYTLHGRLIRAASVVVSNGAQKE